MNDVLQERWDELFRRMDAQGYNSLSPEDRVWLNTRTLIDSIENGGLISYFYNSGADTLADTLAALDELGALGIKDDVERVCALFPGGVPADLEGRNEIIDSWPDVEEETETDSLLNEVDDRLMPRMGNLEKSLMAYLSRHGIATEQAG